MSSQRVNIAPPTPPPIAEQVLDTDEYLLLAAAVSAAERPVQVALSCYLSASAAIVTIPSPTTPPLLLTLFPRPRFPPSLHAILLPLVFPSTSPTPNLHAALHFHPSLFSHLSHLCADHGIIFPNFPPSLAALAAHLSTRALSKPTVTRAFIAEILSTSLWPHLLHFQRRAVEQAILTMRGRVLFADDMGMGKTLQALAVADFFQRTHPNTGPALVLCPPTLRHSWRQALTRWLPHLSALSIHLVDTPSQFQALSKGKDAPPRDPWDSDVIVSYVVCSYNLLPRVQPLPLHFGTVIVDECHNLRNITTARTSAILPVLLSADVRILVSGTPALSRPSELYPLLHALLHTEDVPFLHYPSFMTRYNADFALNPTRPSNASINEHELNALLSTVMIRRLKSDVASTSDNPALPPKDRVHVIIEIPPDKLDPLSRQLEETNELTTQIKDAVMKSDPSVSELRSRREMLFTSSYCRTGELKIPGVLARIHAHLIPQRTGTDNTGENISRKLLVFAYHLDVLDAVSAFAKRHDISSVRIDGDTNVKQRAALVDDFQTNSTIRLGVLSLGAAATGVTLTAADVVLFAELAWVPSTLAQAEDRAHRIGRRGKVDVEYIIAPGTLDDAMMTALGRKAGVLNRAVDSCSKSRKVACDVLGRPSKRIKLNSFDVESIIAKSIAWVGSRVEQTTQDSEEVCETFKGTPCQGVTKSLTQNNDNDKAGPDCG